MATAKLVIDLSPLEKDAVKVCEIAARRALSFVVQSAKSKFGKRLTKSTSKPGAVPKIHKSTAKGWLVQHSENIVTHNNGATAYLGADYVSSKTTNDSLVTLNEGGPNKGTFISRYRKNLKKKVPRLPKSSPLFYKNSEYKNMN